MDAEYSIQFFFDNTLETVKGRFGDHEMMLKSEGRALKPVSSDKAPAIGYMGVKHGTIHRYR